VANPRAILVCTRCSREREHYTRKDGSTVRPCVDCSKALATERANSASEAQQQRQREAYRRYNESAKGQARLRRHHSRDD